MPQNPKHFEKIIDNIHELIDKGSYLEASGLIDCVGDLSRVDPILTFFKALCKYELDDDLGCLNLLSDFLKQQPFHVKADYCIFTTAICLKNLGLEEEALPMLRMLPTDYPGLNDELENTEQIIKVKLEARMLGRSIAQTRAPRVSL